jgi:hypothetical protein
MSPASTPVVIDEVHRLADAAHQLREHVARADHHRRGTVAVEHLLAGGALGQAMFGGYDQGVAAAGGGNIDGVEQCRGAGALRAGHVQGAQVGGVEVHGLGEDHRVLAVGERQRGRCQQQRRRRLAGGTAQGIRAGLGGHGDGVLVPVAHGLLALGEPAQAGIEPGVGVRDHLLLQSRARQIGAVGCDADHSQSPSMVMVGRNPPATGAG